MVWGMTLSPLYSGLSLNRAHALRQDGDLAAMARRPGTRFSLFWRGRQLIGAQGAGVALLTRERAEAIGALDGTTLLLGEDMEGLVLARDVSAIEAGEDGPGIPDCRWASLRGVGPALPAPDAALLAYARGMLLWRDKTRFCPVCAAPLAAIDAGHALRCTEARCGTLQFPRTDPAIIMLVTDPAGHALLGRQAAWPPGMYSCLAGFVEPGETLEEAVAREVAEEAGIRVTRAAYVASQPWPFPCSLMIGFEAEADAAPPRPDTHELEDARWFSRAEAARFGEADQPGEGGLFLPRKDSIARLLVNRWLEG